MKKTRPIPQAKYTLTVRIIVLLLIAVVPLLAIYYRAFSISQSILQTEMSDSLARQNQDFADRLKDDIQRILSTNHMLASNWEIGKLGVMPDAFSLFEKAQTLKNIQDKIYLAQINSRFIKSISVYFPAFDKSISTDLISSTLQAMRKITANINNITHDAFIYYDGEMILVSQTTFNEQTGVPNLVVKTSLSERELKLFFQGNDINEIVHTAVFSFRDDMWLNDDEISPQRNFLENEVKSRLAQESERFQTSGMLQSAYEGQEYQIIYTYLPTADVVLMHYYDLAQMRGSIQAMRILLWLFAAVVALVFLWIYITLRAMVNRPLKRLMKAFRQVEGGNLQLSPHTEEKGEFAYIFKGFDDMLSRLRILVDHTYWQGQMVKRAEFKQLQAQIDPHFLYNGFFILNKRIRARDFSGALSFSQLLSDYFRYVTQNMHDTVSLQSEVSHVYNYIHIQQARFKHRLILDMVPLPEAYDDICIPRLVLQPICENVFKHVLDYSEKPLTLRIRYSMAQAQFLEIGIEDSGQGLMDSRLQKMREQLHAPVEEEEISGLTNVDKRLRLFYGDACGLSFERSDLGGLLVRIRIDAQKRGGAI